jgi:hypothetical protein
MSMRLHRADQPALAALCSLLLVLGIAAPVAAQHNPTLRLKADNATGTAVLVERTASTETGGGELQTWLLTAYHNIYKKTEVRLEDGYGQSVGLDALADAPICVLTALDVAAVRISPAGNQWLGARVDAARLSRSVPDTDGGTYALGNPKLRILGGDYYPYDYRAEGGVGKRQLASLAIPNQYLAPAVRDQDLLLLNDFTITYGFSGGPVFAKNDDSRTLVGIVQGGDASKGKIAWATPADLIDQALDHTDACAPVAYPFGPGTNWPPQGFHATTYSALDSPARISVDAWTPNPLHFHRDESQTVALRVRVARSQGDGEAHDAGSEIVIDPLEVAGLELEAGLDARVPNQDFIDFSYAFHVTSAFKGKQIRIPFVMRTADQTELQRFAIDGTVEADDTFEWAIDAGGDYVPSTAAKIGHFAFGWAPEIDLSGRGTTFALRVGAGMAFLFTGRRTLAPVDETVLDRSDLFAPGLRIEVLPELRLWRRDRVGLRVAFGTVTDVYFFGGPHGLGLVRLGIPVQASLALQISGHTLLPRVQVAYEHEPGVDYKYQQNLFERAPLRSAWRASVGLGCSYVTSF